MDTTTSCVRNAVSICSQAAVNVMTELLNEAFRPSRRMINCPPILSAACKQAVISQAVVSIAPEARGDDTLKHFGNIMVTDNYITIPGSYNAIKIVTTRPISPPIVTSRPVPLRLMAGWGDKQPNIKVVRPVVAEMTVTETRRSTVLPLVQPVANEITAAVTAAVTSATPMTSVPIPLTTTIANTIAAAIPTSKQQTSKTQDVFSKQQMIIKLMLVKLEHEAKMSNYKREREILETEHATKMAMMQRLQQLFSQRKTNRGPGIF